jgi:transcriptional regulator with XRE-family HTH domain
VTQLRQRRYELGLTLDRLAKRAGISKQSVWVYETSGGRPTPGQLHKYSRALGWPVGRTMKALWPDND